MNNFEQSRDQGAGKKIPLSYFITFTCYGTWLHGDQKGSVDSEQNTYNTPFKPGNLKLKRISRKCMKQDPYQMNRPRRRILKQTILDVCNHRDWLLVALHVRSKHLHAVVHAKTKPKRITNDFKSYGSRRLNKSGYDHEDRKRWTRGGSGIFLWQTDQVQSAIRYTFHRQGKPMERYLHPDLNAQQFHTYDHNNDLTLNEFFQAHGILDSTGRIGQSKERTIELRENNENRGED